MNKNKREMQLESLKDLRMTLLNLTGIIVRIEFDIF